MNRLPCETCDPLGVTPHRFSRLLARLGVPQPHRVVHTARRDLSFQTVPFDAEQPARVARERSRGSLRVEVPQAAGVVARTGREVLARRREGCAEDRRCVACREKSKVSECAWFLMRSVARGKHSPSRLLLHREISLTRKTASGSQSIMKTSSVLTLLACFGCVKRSAWIERAMGSRRPSSGAAGLPPSSVDSGLAVEGS